MTEYEFHPIANIFPMMSDSDLQDLTNDIKTNGLQDPIILLDDKILDGRNRYQACLLTGVEPVYVPTKISDPISFVMSRNLHRRHLTPSQKAMVADKARGYYDQEAKKRQKEAGEKHGREKTGKLPETLPEANKGDARDQAGAAVGVSGKTVDKAKKVCKTGIPELTEAVEVGNISLSAAVKIAALPKDLQTEVMEQFKAGTKPAAAIKQATATPTEVLLDGDKRPVPPRLKDIFLAAEDFRQWSLRISQLKREVRIEIQGDEAAFVHFHESAFRAALKKAADQLNLSAPFIVCPYCGGIDSDNCTGCRGCGYLSRAQARCVPQEMRLREDTPEATESANAGGLG